MKRTTGPASDLRIILLAPESGTSGVGDYADDFAAAIRPHVREVIEFRHPPARAASVAAVLGERRRLRALVRDHAGEPLVVHSELSGGAVVPFWATLGLPVRRSATVHDAPRPVWYPFLTRGVSKAVVLNQAIHRPLHGVLERLERRALREVDLFALTEAGVAATRALGMGRSVTRAEHMLPTLGGPSPGPASARPAAVGLFGHVYKGKGFDLLPALRSALPDDLEIVVAGRGTESLPATPGVRVLGGVEGPAEAAFFASIRVLLMPYARPPVGGRAMLPASGAHLRAIVSGTPGLALRSPDTEHLGTDGLCQMVDGGAAELARAAAALAYDPDALDRIQRRLEEYVAAVGERDLAAPFLRVWESR